MCQVTAQLSFVLILDITAMLACGMSECLTAISLLNVCSMLPSILHVVYLYRIVSRACLHGNVFFGTALNCPALHCTALHYPALLRPALRCRCGESHGPSGAILHGVPRVHT